MKWDIIITVVWCLLFTLILSKLLLGDQVEESSPCEAAKIEIMKAVDKGYDQQTLNILGETALKICGQK